jgi:hypothetical protein
MTQSPSRLKKKNRRRLARATARYFCELDEAVLKEENRLVVSLCSKKRIN